MNFWENVDKELEFRGMTRKALAQEAGFNLGNVGKGIKLGSSPSADTAVKIAKVLNVTVEYLVIGSDFYSKTAQKEIDNEINLFKEYRNVFHKLNSLPESTRKPIIEMIEKINIE